MNITFFAALLFLIASCMSSTPPTPTADPTDHEALFASLFDVLGTDSIILPIGSPDDEMDDSAVVTRGAIPAYVQYSIASDPASRLLLDQPLYHLGTSAIPVQPLNGQNERIHDFTDRDWYSRDDANGEGFSMGIWAKLVPNGKTQTLLSKYAAGGNQSEWRMGVDAGGSLFVELYDASERTSYTTITETGTPLGTFTLYGFSFDGVTQTVTLYQDGHVIASTGAVPDTYEGMENLLHGFSVGDNGSTQLLQGDVAGGPLGPFITHDTLTAEDWANIYAIGATALGVE